MVPRVRRRNIPPHHNIDGIAKQIELAAVGLGGREHNASKMSSELVRMRPMASDGPLFA